MSSSSSNTSFASRSSASSIRSNDSKTALAGSLAVGRSPFRTMLTSSVFGRSASMGPEERRRAPPLSRRSNLSADVTPNNDDFEIDRSILPNPELNHKRRTVILMRNNFNETFGFALQSYVFRRSKDGDPERITYIDYVRAGSAAAIAGLRRGDIVVAVNGVSVVNESHSSLVSLMSSQLRMRLVLLFQNVARMISLSARALQLQYILAEKMHILEKIEEDERKLLSGAFRTKGKRSLDTSPTKDAQIALATSEEMELSTIEASTPTPPPIADEYDVDCNEEEDLPQIEVALPPPVAESSSNSRDSSPTSSSPTSEQHPEDPTPKGKSVAELTAVFEGVTMRQKVPLRVSTISIVDPEPMDDDFAANGDGTVEFIDEVVVMRGDEYKRQKLATSIEVTDEAGAGDATQTATAIVTSTALCHLIRVDSSSSMEQVTRL